MGSVGSAMKAMFWSSWALGLSEAVQVGWTVAAATVTPEGLEVLDVKKGDVRGSLESEQRRGSRRGLHGTQSLREVLRFWDV